MSDLLSIPFDANCNETWAPTPNIGDNDPTIVYAIPL
jgi:hypothetical protein